MAFRRDDWLKARANDEPVVQMLNVRDTKLA